MARLDDHLFKAYEELCHHSRFEGPDPRDCPPDKVYLINPASYRFERLGVYLTDGLSLKLKPDESKSNAVIYNIDLEKKDG